MFSIKTNGFFNLKDVSTLLLTMGGLMLTLIIRDRLAPYDKQIAVTTMEVKQRLSELEKDVEKVNTDMSWMREHVISDKEFEVVMRDIERRLVQCEQRARRTSLRAPDSYVSHF